MLQIPKISKNPDWEHPEVKQFDTTSHCLLYIYWGTVLCLRSPSIFGPHGSGCTCVHGQVDDAIYKFFTC
jgi:hypothetical protein